LHGWLHGQGDAGVATINDDSKWLVVEVESSSIVQLGGKVKFPRALVRFAGDRKTATDYLLANDPLSLNVAVIGAQLLVGDKESVTVGAFGTATAGDRGTATAGDRGTATAGDRGTATAGDRGTATAGYGGTATAGDRGTATAGYGGTATAGDRGTATAGYGGTATAGYRGTATAGYGGTATAGYGGTVQVKWWDAKRDNYRIVTGYVGEDGIKANTPYVLDSNHKLVPAAK
jgi:hypothetical protein